MSNPAPRIEKVWTSAAASVDTALRTARESVAAPMMPIAEAVVMAGNATNCKGAYMIYITGSRSLGQRFVEAQVLLWSCCTILAVCSALLTLLYCFLWGLRQSGTTHRPRPPLLGVEDEGAPSDDEDDSDNEGDEEAELQKPLKRSWRGR